MVLRPVLLSPNSCIQSLNFTASLTFGFARTVGRENPDVISTGKETNPVDTKIDPKDPMLLPMPYASQIEDPMMGAELFHPSTKRHQISCFVQGTKHLELSVHQSMTHTSKIWKRNSNPWNGLWRPSDRQRLYPGLGVDGTVMHMPGELGIILTFN